jgi:hypothetical protein
MLRRKSKIVVGPALIIFPNLILPGSPYSELQTINVEAPCSAGPRRIRRT